MSKKAGKAVKKPAGGVGGADIQAIWHTVVVQGRHLGAWARDFYLFRTFWLEVVILLFVAVFAGYVLYAFLYAEPKEPMPAVPEKKLELNVSMLEALRLWKLERGQAYEEELRFPRTVFRL